MKISSLSLYLFIKIILPVSAKDDRKTTDLMHTNKCQHELLFKSTDGYVAYLIENINKLRNDVAIGKFPDFVPSVSNMAIMEWDLNLVEAAKELVSICNEDNLPCEDCLKVGPLHGSAVYFHHNLTKFNFEFLNRSLHHLGEESIDKKILKILTFPDANYLGCSAMVPSWLSSSHLYEVCIVGSKKSAQYLQPFKTGPPCSNCPEGQSCTGQKFPGLCANTRKKRNNVGSRAFLSDDDVRDPRPTADPHSTIVVDETAALIQEESVNLDDQPEDIQAGDPMQVTAADSGKGKSADTGDGGDSSTDNASTVTVSNFLHLMSLVISIKKCISNNGDMFKRLAFATTNCI